MQRLRRKWTEHANKWNFTKSKGHNSIVLIMKPDLYIIIIDLYTKFHLNTYNLCEEKERKLLADWATDSSKAIRPNFFEWGHKKEYLVETWIQMKKKEFHIMKSFSNRTFKDLSVFTFKTQRCWRTNMNIHTLKIQKYSWLKMENNLLVFF